ncbi:MAG: hypothetical protein ACRDZV_03470 [Acidimicrobiia bacterium]
MNRFTAPGWRMLALLLIAALALGACSDDDTDGSLNTGESTSTTRRPTTTTTVDPSEAGRAEVEAAYTASSRAFIDAAAIPDPNFPALAATHTGPMLEQSRNVLRALQADGRIIRYPPNSRYRVEIDGETLQVEGDVARFELCGVDDGERVVVATGEVVAGGVVTVRARVAMQRADGSWRLAERQQLAEWEGVAGCALE